MFGKQNLCVQGPLYIWFYQISQKVNTLLSEHPAFICCKELQGTDLAKHSTKYYLCVMDLVLQACRPSMTVDKTLKNQELCTLFYTRAANYLQIY